MMRTHTHKPRPRERTRSLKIQERDRLDQQFADLLDELRLRVDPDDRMGGEGFDNGRGFENDGVLKRGSAAIAWVLTKVARRDGGVTIPGLSYQKQVPVERIMARLRWSRAAQAEVLDGERIALAGRCRRCGRHFVNRSGQKDKSFCKGCGKAFYAAAAMRKKRAAAARTRA